jgi:type I restriction enzyme S subunit
MTNDIRNARLSDLYEFQYGTGNTIENIGGDYPIYGSNGTVGYTNIYNSEDAPVIGHIGAYAGIVNWASGKHFVTYNGVICKIKNGINPRYGYYSLLNSKLQKNLRGSTQPFISYDLLNDVKVYLPDRQDQDKIASVLSALDFKIDINNRINKELEAMAKTIYDYWFVQFDFPDKKGKPYKSSGGKMVWNDELKREVPEGWEVNELRTLIEIQRGISYTSKDIEGDGVPMINLNSFNLNGTYKAEGVKNYSGKYSEKNLIKNGDLLIAATDVTRNAEIIGKAILVPDYYTDSLVFSMDIAKVSSNHLPVSFLMMLFNSNHYHNYIKWFATGTLVLHLNLDGVNRYVSEIPPSNILRMFDEFYMPIANRIYNTAKENKELSELRDWLLPMLMNGQVTFN